jgi:hypothetical protein
MSNDVIIKLGYIAMGTTTVRYSMAAQSREAANTDFRDVAINTSSVL